MSPACPRQSGILVLGMRARLDSLTTAIGECDVAIASPRHATAVLGLRDSLARHLLDRGVQQWKPGELPAEWIEDRIAAGSVYVVHRHNQLIGLVTITSDDSLILGEREDLAGYMHLLMIDRAFAPCVPAWVPRRPWPDRAADPAAVVALARPACRYISADLAREPGGGLAG